METGCILHNNIYYHYHYHTYLMLYSIMAIIIQIIAEQQGSIRRPSTVCFHNFNLQIFNLRVSNPKKSIVDAFLTRCRISMCQGLGPRKQYQISEIDRISGYIYLFIISLFSEIFLLAEVFNIISFFIGRLRKLIIVPHSINSKPIIVLLVLVLLVVVLLLFSNGSVIY